MEKEYKTEELHAVWRALVDAYNEKGEGSTPADIAAETGISEDVARACLEYLCQDGKAARDRGGKRYAPDPKYVRNVTVRYAADEVNKYLVKKRSATIDEIVQGIKNESGETIKPKMVEYALGYLREKGLVKYSQVTRKWVALSASI
jgi:transcription initiation factor IIE alpha subunit